MLYKVKLDIEKKKFLNQDKFFHNNSVSQHSSHQPHCPTTPAINPIVPPPQPLTPPPPTIPATNRIVQMSHEGLEFDFAPPPLWLSSFSASRSRDFCYACGDVESPSSSLFARREQVLDAGGKARHLSFTGLGDLGSQVVRLFYAATAYGNSVVSAGVETGDVRGGDGWLLGGGVKGGC